MAATSTGVRVVGVKGDGTRFAAQTINRLILLYQNRVLTAAAVATGTTTSKVKTVATATFTIDGTFKTKAATDDLWTLSGTVVAASMFQKYLLLLNAAGTASIQEGIQASAAAGVVFNTLPDAKAIIGIATVATDSSTTFTPGTTLLGAAGITTTYVDGFDNSLLPLVGDAFNNTVLTDLRN